MSPPDYEREVPSLSHPPPCGFNAPDTKKIRQGPNYRPCRIFLVPGEGFKKPPRETRAPLSGGLRSITGGRIAVPWLPSRGSRNRCLSPEPDPPSAAVGGHRTSV